MNKSNFLTTLLTLNIKEARKFENHLNAHFRNSKILLDIFQFYHKLHLKKKVFPSLEVAFEKIFKIVPQQKKGLIKLQNGLSDLNIILKDFLIQLKITESGFEKEMLWLQISEERELLHQRDLHLKKIKKQIKKNNLKSIWEPLHELQLVHFEFFKNDFKKNKFSINLMQEGLEAMNDFYISLQLKYAAESLNRAHLLSLPPSTMMPLLNTILDSLKKNTAAFSLQNQLYYYIYLFLNNTNFKQFTQLKSFVFSHQKSLHREERLSALMYLINYCAAELKKGNLQLLEETFELYKWGLDGEKIMVYNGRIDSLQFHNMINISCRLKAFTWSKNFIETHQQFLEEDSKTQNVSIGYAMIYFAEKQFQKVLDCFTNVKFSEVIFEIRAKIYLLASEYELGNNDDLDQRCDSFIRIVRRNKNLGESNTIAATNFARIIQYLQKKKMYKKEIRAKIENENALFFKTWLLEKLASYKRF